MNTTPFLWHMLNCICCLGILLPLNVLPNAYAIDRTCTIFKDCRIVSGTGPLLVVGIRVSTTKKERRGRAEEEE